MATPIKAPIVLVIVIKNPIHSAQKTHLASAVNRLRLYLKITSLSSEIHTKIHELTLWVEC